MFKALAKAAKESEAQPQSNGTSSHKTMGKSPIKPTSLPQSSLDQLQHQQMSVKARRRREEAVRRLVADVHRRPEVPVTQQLGGNTTLPGTTTDTNIINSSLTSQSSTQVQIQQQHDWMVASTVAAALERGLDRDLHAELVSECKDNSTRIGQICHSHSEDFLASVSHVVALGHHSSTLNVQLDGSFEALSLNSNRMLEAAVSYDHWSESHARAVQLQKVVRSCHQVASLLERARKQATLGRPRAALDAVDQARHRLAAPVAGVVSSVTKEESNGGAPTTSNTEAEETTPTANNTNNNNNKPIRLEETPFGQRASLLCPKIENEVIIGARRGLNRWFLSLRSGGDQSKAGRAILRRAAHSMAVGPGQLGVGGHLPPSYVWRAKTADNLILRLDQQGRVARAVRLGYWFEREAPNESERLENLGRPGVERKAEAFASAFGWYRCWDDHLNLMVDLSDLPDTVTSGNSGLNGSRHGLRGSRHGLSGSRHGRKSLSFRATSKSTSTTLRTAQREAKNKDGSEKRRVSAWAELLTPSVMFQDAPSRKEDDQKLVELPESVHPVRRAEQAFNLLGRHEEFIQYYEQNRFGDMKISGGSDKKKDDKGEVRSSLSSLTGDDVSVGTHRIFFAKSLPHLCASVVGFSGVEAALELGNFGDDDEEDPTFKNVSNEVKQQQRSSTTDSASRFRDSSARYERSLVAELGNLLRRRAIGASLAELARASSLMAAFRSALKITHPSSSTRRSDKELLAMDVDIIMTALKVAQDEQLKATSRIVSEDTKEPMPIALSDISSNRRKSRREEKKIPDEEKKGLPFGLQDMKQKVDRKKDQDLGDRRYNQRDKDEYYTFSQCVPDVVRALHARSIAISAFALSQEELGQVFSAKKGSSGAASYVLDCVEACVSVATVGMQDSESVLDEGSVEKAVQSMANIHAVQHTLPRLFGTLMRGMCHVGMIRADQLEETFQYAETTLKGADKACDAQIGSCYSLVYEICRNKLDAHINYALDGFQWVSKTARDMPNAYCEGVIGYLRSVFASLGPMDDGSRAGLHFSCCGHVAERLMKLLADPVTDTSASSHQRGDDNLPPIARIDAFGLKNFATDVQEFEDFCDTTGVPQLSECFNELKSHTNALIDRDLPILLQPENAAKRRRKYPFLNIEKLANILEKYVGMGLGDKLMGGSGKNTDILLMEKKEVVQLLRLARAQQQ